MMESPEMNLERAFNRGGIPGDIEHHAIAMTTHNGQTVVRCELNDGLILLFGGAKAPDEIIRLQELMEVGAARIIKPG